MDSWEDFADEDQQPVAVAQGAYDEATLEAESAIKDSWDDDDEGDKTNNKAASTKKKRSLQQILKEREAMEAQKAKELAEKKAQQEQESLETEFDRKARLAKAVKDADFQNAVALLGGIGTENGGTVSGIDNALPKTKEDFDKFASAIADKVLGLRAKNAIFMGFLEKLFRELVDPLDYSDVRKLSSALATVSNEKQRADKERKTGKKMTAVKKAQVRVDVDSDMGPGAFNPASYDEYDDFM